MTLHKKHTHGHAFSGEEAREQLAMHKRDSHGDKIKMNIPEGFVLANKDGIATDSVAATAISVVYVTLPQTFSGAAVYSTLSDTPASTTPAAVFAAAATNQPAQAVSSASPSADGSDDSDSFPTFGASAASSSAALPTATGTLFLGGGLASTTPGSTVVLGQPLQNTRSSALAVQTGAQSFSSSNSNSTITGNSTDNAGMSGGAKAGIAFGLIAGLALIAGLVFFCWRRRRNPDGHEELLDEKHTSFVDAKARSVESRSRNSFLNSTRSASTAPRLSLRPVTQFLPNLGGEAAQNGGNGFLAAGAAKQAWDRRPANNANPFDDTTALVEKPRANSPPHNPFEESQASGPNSARHTPKTSWSGSESGAPVGANAAAAASGPAGSPAVRGPNNVHRVQLDFKPSMDDELELRSGQLVRMLHEYDDGWALCIRMDRSQQGVAPRTCLSKLPVKPRPQGPPPNGPNSRPGTAQSGRRPSNPQGPGMYPRPLTPTQAGRDRAPSANGNHGPTSPNGGQLPSRKPVPGQAL